MLPEAAQGGQTQEGTKAWPWAVGPSQSRPRHPGLSRKGPHDPLPELRCLYLHEARVGVAVLPVSSIQRGKLRYPRGNQRGGQHTPLYLLSAFHPGFPEKLTEPAPVH